MTVKAVKCDADGGAICDRPACWRSVRELADGGGRFEMYFCDQHEDQTRQALHPAIKLLRVDRIPSGEIQH